MFVSTYTTYINTNSTDRAQKERLDSQRDLSSRFELKKELPAQTQTSLVQQVKTQLPVDYISNYKVLNNQQKLQDNTQTKTEEKTKFTKIITLNNAKNAYSENSILFASLMKPKVTLSQTPSLDYKLAEDSFGAQESILKHKMINTYIANENYYKITA